MQYLVQQSLVWLISAGLIGAIIGYLLRSVNCKRDKDRLRDSAVKCRAKLGNAKTKIKTLENELQKSIAESAQLKEQLDNAERSEPAQEVSVVKEKHASDKRATKGRPVAPKGISKANADNLKEIKGIGPAIEKSLNAEGIYTFKQIAEFTEENITWVDTHISVPGRVKRDEWVDQCKAFIKK